MRRIRNAFRDIFGAVRRINEKYRYPRIKMTPMVSLSLLILRLYLLSMLVLLAYKFISIVTAR